MTQFSARYYDGVRSSSELLECVVDESGWLTAGGADLRLHVGELVLRPAIGSVARQIELPGGGRLEVDDHAAIDAISERWSLGDEEKLAHRLEHNLHFVALSLLLIIAIGFSGIKYGIPVASYHIAHALPEEIDQQLGGGVMEQLEDRVFFPTELEEAQQQALADQFTKLQRVSDREFTLLLRSAPDIGANAFALPDGTIVVTDELMMLTENVDELSGIRR